MACPRDDLIGTAIVKCPFLHNLSVTHGESFARSIAQDPTRPAQTLPAPRPILEEQDDFQRTFAFFHAPRGGVFPLKAASYEAAASQLPRRAPEQQCPQASRPAVQVGVQQLQQQLGARLAAAPLASIGINVFGRTPNFGDFFNRMRKQNQQRSPHQPPQSSGSAGAGGGGGGAPKQGGGGSGSNRPRAASGGINLTGGGSSNAAAAQAGGGQCPMRKVLGPVSKLLFTPQRLECPKLVVDMRAALARTQAVRALRPQELHIKVLTIGALAAALNMPCGAVREHYEKFSLGWFVAVHATIPFVAMMRKAVIMPKYAIIFTIAAAIAGQAVGARLERKRLAAAREAVAAATAAAAPPRVAEPLVVVAAAASTGKAGQRLGSPARQCPAKQMCSKAAGSLAVATAVAQPVTRPQQLLLRSH